MDEFIALFTQPSFVPKAQDLRLHKRRAFAHNTDTKFLEAKLEFLEARIALLEAQLAKKSDEPKKKRRRKA
jgi:hypothetical protein